MVCLPHRVRVSSTTIAESETGCDVKKELSYLAFNYDTELKSTEKRPYCQIDMLSDGNIITIGGERFRCESIFLAMCWLIRLAKESNCAVFFFFFEKICGSRVKRVVTRDRGFGSLLRCYF